MIAKMIFWLRLFSVKKVFRFYHCLILSKGLFQQCRFCHCVFLSFCLCVGVKIPQPQNIGAPIYGRTGVM